MLNSDKETTINIETDGTATIYSNMSEWYRKLMKLAEKYDDVNIKDVSRNAKGNINGYIFTLPASYIKLGGMYSKNKNKGE
jgi:hypothetical protein